MIKSRQTSAIFAIALTAATSIAPMAALSKPGQTAKSAPRTVATDKVKLNLYKMQYDLPSPNLVADPKQIAIKRDSDGAAYLSFPDEGGAWMLGQNDKLIAINGKDTKGLSNEAISALLQRPYDSLTPVTVYNLAWLAPYTFYLEAKPGALQQQKQDQDDIFRLESSFKSNHPLTSLRFYSDNALQLFIDSCMRKAIYRTYPGKKDGALTVLALNLLQIFDDRAMFDDSNQIIKYAVQRSATSARDLAPTEIVALCDLAMYLAQTERSDECGAILANLLNHRSSMDAGSKMLVLSAWAALDLRDKIKKTNTAESLAYIDELYQLVQPADSQYAAASLHPLACQLARQKDFKRARQIDELYQQTIWQSEFKSQFNALDLPLLLRAQLRYAQCCTTAGDRDAAVHSLQLFKKLSDQELKDWVRYLDRTDSVSAKGLRSAMANLDKGETNLGAFAEPSAISPRCWYQSGALHDHNMQSNLLAMRTRFDDALDCQPLHYRWWQAKLAIDALNSNDKDKDYALLKDLPLQSDKDDPARFFRLRNTGVTAIKNTPKDLEILLAVDRYLDKSPDNKSADGGQLLRLIPEPWVASFFSHLAHAYAISGDPVACKRLTDLALTKVREDEDKNLLAQASKIDDLTALTAPVVTEANTIDQILKSVETDMRPNLSAFPIQNMALLLTKLDRTMQQDPQAIKDDTARRIARVIDASRPFLESPETTELKRKVILKLQKWNDLEDRKVINGQSLANILEKEAIWKNTVAEIKAHATLDKGPAQVTSYGGPQNRQLIKIEQDLALEAAASGDATKAMSHIKNAMQIAEYNHGIHGVDTLYPRSTYIGLLNKYGRSQDALAQEKIITIRSYVQIPQKYLGQPQSVMMMSPNRDTYTDDARPFLEYLLDFQSQALGEADTQTLKTLNALIDFCLARSLYDDALKYQTRYLDVLSQTVGTASDEYVRNQLQLATIDLAAGRKTAALAIVRNMQPFKLATLLGQDNLVTAAAIYLEAGASVQAQKLLQQLKEPYANLCNTATPYMLPSGQYLRLTPHQKAAYLWEMLGDDNRAARLAKILSVGPAFARLDRMVDNPPSEPWYTYMDGRWYCLTLDSDKTRPQGHYAVPINNQHVFTARRMAMVEGPIRSYSWAPAAKLLMEQAIKLQRETEEREAKALEDEAAAAAAAKHKADLKSYERTDYATARIHTMQKLTEMQRPADMQNDKSKERK